MKVTHLHACDLVTVAEGGIPTHIRQIVTNAQKVDHRLVGVTKNLEFPLGRWSDMVLLDKLLFFFPILSVKADHLTYTKGVPLNAKYLLALVRYLPKIKRQTEVFHFHRIIMALPLLFTKNPWVVTMHGTNQHWATVKDHFLFSKKWFRFLFWKLERFVLKRAQKVIFVNEEHLEQYTEMMPYLEDKSICIPNVINLDNFKPLGRVEACKEKYKLPTNKKIVFSFGRLDEVKGLELLIEIYEHLSNGRDDLALVIAGDGKMRGTLDDMVREKGLQDVYFLGHIRHEDLPQLINCGDVFVVTSYFEGGPITAIESLACGVPVVATKVGIIESLVKNGVTGFCIDARDPDLFAEKIDQMLNCEGDLKDVCRKSVSQYSEKKHMAALEDFYLSIEC